MTAHDEQPPQPSKTPVNPWWVLLIFASILLCFGWNDYQSVDGARAFNDDLSNIRGVDDVPTYWSVTEESPTHFVVLTDAQSRSLCDIATGRAKKTVQGSSLGWFSITLQRPPNLTRIKLSKYSKKACKYKSNKPLLLELHFEKRSKSP